MSANALLHSAACACVCACQEDRQLRCVGLDVPAVTTPEYRNGVPFNPTN
jgi:hypothetical protein